MMIRRPKGLGRGLDALLGDSGAAVVEAPPGAPQTLTLEQLRPGRYQPRTKMDPDSLSELADSIRAQGVIQPILVRPAGNDTYEIIAGERRYRAAQIAGLTEVPVLVKRVSDEAALAIALIENIQREDLNALEHALRPTQPREPSHPTADRDLTRLQEELSDALGTTVSVRVATKGRGQIRIAFASLDQLQGLIQRLRQ